MSGIEAVIARSRMEGGFSERRRFTIARREGIEKMRKFALADPHHYVLEVIQAAIANGAQYVDLQVTKTHTTISYIGGGLAEHELAELFDFLFASKDRADIGHVRELALGLNAALLFKPQRIVVESGDGTLAGSTRMVLHGEHGEIEVGRPDRAMSGTYIAVQDMNRRAMDGTWLSNFNAEWPREYQVIEQRCLAAPIPIVVGGRPLFGWASQRTPGLFGYKNVLAFDEGDLYGAIGISPSFGNPDFRLLTWGVAIQSRSHALLPGHQIGGIVCFDRLHKTVDHSGIVDDARLQELWARLKPYAHQLVSGKKHESPYGATLLGHDEPLVPATLRALVCDAKRVVVVPPSTAIDAPEGRRAIAIGRSLRAPVLCVLPDQARLLTVLAGGTLGIVQPDLSDDSDVAFFAKSPATAPPRPWLASPVDVTPLPPSAIAKRLRAANHVNTSLRELAFADTLGSGEVLATVYAPADLDAGASELIVELLTCDRMVWRGGVPSAHGGYVLVVRLPNTPPSVLRRAIDTGPAAPTVAQEVARAVAEHAAGALATAFDRAVADLERNPSCKPGTRAASLGLAAAGRSSIARLCEHDGRPAFELLSLATTPSKALDLPLLASLDGRTHSLREVVANATEGLLYGVIPEVPADLDGLDTARILSLSAADEGLVVALVGDAAYVRVDARDLLADHRGVLVRDVALGLRQYPDFPLLVEGCDPSAWSEAERAECLDVLLAELILRFLGVQPPRPAAPEAYAGWEENRRQSCRHLQWAAVHLGDAAPEALADLPLFADADGHTYDWSTLQPALASHPLPVVYGQGLGDHELGRLTAAALNPREAPQTTPPALLATPPFVHHLLARSSAYPASAATSVPGAEPDFAVAMLATVDIASGEFRGHVGVPTDVRDCDIVVVLPDGRRIRASAIARKYGIVGVVRVTAQRWSRDCNQRLLSAVDGAGQTAMRAVLSQMRAPSRSDHSNDGRRIDVLLKHAATDLELSAHPDGRVEATVNSDLSTEILGLAVFESRFGGPVAAWRLVLRFTAVAHLDEDPTASVLRDLEPSLDPALRAWIEANLTPAAVSRPAARPAVRPTSHPTSNHPTSNHPTSNQLRITEYASHLAHWLGRLRPDDGDPIDISVQYRGRKETWISEDFGGVTLNGDHWIVQWGLDASAQDPLPVAWTLLAAYAHINESRDEVTTEHERAFQRRVAQALASGKLAPS